jgi:hypothetical protein
MSKGCAVVGAVMFFALVIGLCIVLPVMNVFTHLPPAGVATETTHPIPGLTAAQTDGLWSLVLGTGVILTVAAIVRSVARSRGPKTITGNPGPEFVRPMDGVVEPWAANVPMGEIMQRVGVKRPAYRLDLFSTSHEQDAIDRATPITEMSVDLRETKR